jgi:hypothetical protein
MVLKRILFLSGLLITFSCSSGDGNADDSDQSNPNALSVGDTFSGFDALDICANESIVYDYGDTSRVILLSLFASW